MSRSKHFLRLASLAALMVAAATAQAQTAPNAFTANASLPGFAPASTPPKTPPGSVMLQPSVYAGQANLPQIPPPPSPPIQPGAIQNLVMPERAAAPRPSNPPHRLSNSVAPPTSLPIIPPAPVVLPNVAGFGQPSDLIDPSRLKDGTVAVSGSRVETRAGDTKIYLLKVSGTAPNLIQSPFAHPRLMTTSTTSVQFKAHGRNLVLSVTQAGPVGVYITGQSPGDPLIGLVLDPSPIPPRSYVLDVAGYNPQQEGSPGQASEKGAYVQTVVGLMREVVTGNIPGDFTQTGEDRLPGDQMFMGVRLHPVKQYVSPTQSVLELLAKNENTTPARLVENDFYAKGVTAVVIDPVHELKPGEVTHIYVLTSKGEKESALLGVWHGSDSKDNGVGSE
jgi:conjugal transfer pilus assembly protein TraK